MKVRLDPAVTSGPLRVAPLVRQTVHAGHLGRTIAISGSKVPVAILIQAHGTVSAQDLRGRPLERGAVEALCPGAWAAFADAGTH